MSKAFIHYFLTHGLLADLSTDEFPTLLQTWNEGILDFPTVGTHYGYVWRGEPLIVSNAGTFTLQPGMYFSIPENGKLLGAGQGIVITRLGYQGVFSIGGPIETKGRLKYIDGATDSVLIHPPRCGDPVLNALYFKPGVRQTPHTHPSMIGIVVSGYGQCVTLNEVIELTPGQVFVIPANSLHSFHTTNSPLLVVAYHPDSDTGPTDEIHPMLTRTIVHGVSASLLTEIQTR